MREIIKRELRVIFSRKAQPVWFRITKWVVFIGVGLVSYGTLFFCWWIVLVPAVGIIIHFVFRWKTHGWTRPWGRWDDLQAGQKK